MNVCRKVSIRQFLRRFRPCSLENYKSKILFYIYIFCMSLNMWDTLLTFILSVLQSGFVCSGRHGFISRMHHRLVLQRRHTGQVKMSSYIYYYNIIFIFHSSFLFGLLRANHCLQVKTTLRNVLVGGEKLFIIILRLLGKFWVWDKKKLQII